MKRIIKGKEVWIEEKNGKKIYYYYDCPKCGNKKNLKSSYCIPCMNDKHRGRIGIAASSEDVYLKTDTVTDNNSSERTPNQYKLDLINFVNKIEKRGGLASIYEIYVELITLYNHFGRQSSIDTFHLE